MLSKEKLHNIIESSIKNRLDEYHNQLRIPFEEFGGGHAFIDEFVDWIQYSSEKGTLPKPSITFEQGIMMGCGEFDKSRGYLTSSYDDFNENSDIFKYTEFDKNGNLYVERAIKMDVGDINSSAVDLYKKQIEKYEKNVGGCWSYKRGEAESYCGDYGLDDIVLKGYMFLDDIYWAELIRLETRGLREFEVRTKPNGRVMLTEISINGKTITADMFDGPRILKSTFFGNNVKFNGNYAELGYRKIGYENRYIDREGNEYTEDDFLNLRVNDIKKKLAEGEPANLLFDKYFDGRRGLPAIVAVGEKYNFFNPETNQILSEEWFDYCDPFEEDGFGSVEKNGKINFINKDGQLLTDLPTADELIKGKWFSDYYSLNYGFRVISFNTQYSIIKTDGQFIRRELWFDICGKFLNGFAKVKLNGKYNFINEEGYLITELPTADERLKGKWFDDAANFYYETVTVELKGIEIVLDTNGNIVKTSQMSESLNKDNQMNKSDAMKIFSKTKKGLVHIGEGRIYSKRELRLVEDDDKLIGDATPDNGKINGASGLETAVNQELTKHPAEDGVSTDLASLNSTSQQQKGDGMSLQMTQKELSNNKSMISTLANAAPGAELTVIRNESVAAKKNRISEMRKSSIPFTKEEMNKFLENL